MDTAPALLQEPMNPLPIAKEKQMPQTTVRWVTGYQFVGMDSRNQAAVLSGEEKGGGVSPSEMLLIAMSSCSAADMVEIMKKKRKPLTNLEIIATGERDPEPPWAYRKIHLLYRVSGEKLTDKAVAQAIDLSLNKYCSVAATVRGVAEISSDYEIIA
jgi:putative redox protein